MTPTQRMYALAQEQTNNSLALRNAIDNHSWHEAAVVAGKTIANISAMAQTVKEIDPQLVETMQLANAAEFRSLCEHYPMQRTTAQIVAAAEQAVQACAAVVPDIDSNKIIAMLREPKAKAKK